MIWEQHLWTILSYRRPLLWNKNHFILGSIKKPNWRMLLTANSSCWENMNIYCMKNIAANREMLPFSSSSYWSSYWNFNGISFLNFIPLFRVSVTAGSGAALPNCRTIKTLIKSYPTSLIFKVNISCTPRSVYLRLFTSL